jgi:DNA-binding IclR family transcriptional regulator
LFFIVATLPARLPRLYCIPGHAYHDAEKRRKRAGDRNGGETVAKIMRGADKEKSQIQVIARAGAILRALEHEPAGLSLGQIAQRVGLARSTVQRIVAALATEKLVIAASAMGRVRLGPAILRFAASVRTDFVALARPFLVQLSHELRETVDLATVKGDHIVFVDQVVGPQRLRTVSAVGESFPLYCTANGKAYLAELDEREIAALLGRRFEARTANTLTALPALLADLKAARRSGVAFDREEHTVGISAAGVAVRDPAGNYAAISVPVPTLRFKQHQSRIATRLIAAKRSIEGLLTTAEAAE